MLPLPWVLTVRLGRGRGQVETEGAVKFSEEEKIIMAKRFSKLH